MGTHGVGAYSINSKFDSGNLVFYEKAYGRTVTGDVFTIAGGDSGYVRVGNTSQDIDFQWYGTGSKSFILNLGTATATSAGLNWSITGTLAVTGDITLTGDVSLAGDLTLSTEDVSVAQGRAIYLDGQDGGEYITSGSSNVFTANATTTLNLAIGGTAELAVSSTAVTLATNDLTLTAGRASVAERYAIYLDGQGGGEYLVADVANEAMLNATTTLNLAIGGTDEVAVSATAVTLPTNNLTLTAGRVAVAERYAIYLNGQGGTEYVVSDAASDLMLNAATNLNLAIGGTDEVFVSATAVTLPTNDLTLTAGRISTAERYAIYFDGQGGGEYLVSDAANEAMLNATTTLNLSIGGSDKLSMVAATTTLNNDLAITAGEFVVGAPTKMLITNKAADTKYLTAAESGIITASVDHIYLYLPTYVGNSGLTYFVKATAAYAVGVTVYGYDATENIDGVNDKRSAAQYDVLGIVAGSAGWNVINRIGTWV